MSNFDTNRIFSKTSAAVAREHLLFSESVGQVQMDAGTFSSYVVEIRSGHNFNEVLFDSFHEFPVGEHPQQQKKTDESPWLRRRFNMLSEQWKEETLMLSSLSEIAAHPAYQKIIGMGDNALPFILADLAVSGAKWYWALTAITGENPVPANYQGQTDKMTEAWLEWGAMQGYV